MPTWYVVDEEEKLLLQLSLLSLSLRPLVPFITLIEHPSLGREERGKKAKKATGPANTPAFEEGTGCVKGEQYPSSAWRWW